MYKLLVMVYNDQRWPFYQYVDIIGQYLIFLNVCIGIKNFYPSVSQLISKSYLFYKALQILVFHSINIFIEF